MDAAGGGGEFGRESVSEGWMGGRASMFCGHVCGLLFHLLLVRDWSVVCVVGPFVSLALNIITRCPGLRNEGRV